MPRPNPAGLDHYLLYATPGRRFWSLKCDREFYLSGHGYGATNSRTASSQSLSMKNCEESTETIRPGQDDR